VEEMLPSKFEALELKPSTKKRERERNRKHTHRCGFHRELVEFRPLVLSGGFSLLVDILAMSGSYQLQGY
jgi:hypothetical protein